MPRKRYPSDEKRKKQRPHVKLHLSLLSHRKTAGHMDDATFRGQLSGLLLIAAQRFAGATEGELHLSRADVAWISGKRRADVALKSVERLLDILEYSHERRGNVLLTVIPKFAEKQYYGTRLRGESDVGYGDYAPLQVQETTSNTAPSEPCPTEPVELPDVSKWVTALKGKIPNGLNGKTWGSKQEWFADHQEIMVSEAMIRARKEDGDDPQPFFRDCFRSVLFRYWNAKDPKITRQTATTTKENNWEN